MTPLFKEDLDNMGCSSPGCDHTSHDGGMYFHGRCHPEAPAWVYYEDGVIHVKCVMCGKGFGPPVAVASKSAVVLEHLHGAS